MLLCRIKTSVSYHVIGGNTGAYINLTKMLVGTYNIRTIQNLRTFRFDLLSNYLNYEHMK